MKPFFLFFLTISALQARLIGDLAPLQVGNQWVYQWTYTRKSSFGRGQGLASCTSTIVEEMPGDTMLYVFENTKRGYQNDTLVSFDTIRTKRVLYDEKWFDTVMVFDEKIVLKIVSLRDCWSPLFRSRSIETDSIRKPTELDPTYIQVDTTDACSIIVELRRIMANWDDFRQRFKQNVGLIHQVYDINDHGHQIYTLDLLAFRSASSNSVQHRPLFFESQKQAVRTRSASVLNANRSSHVNLLGKHISRQQYGKYFPSLYSIRLSPSERNH